VSTISIATSLDVTTAQRLTRLLGMLGSEHDGEVVNAGRMADRLVRERGLTWYSVILPKVAAPTQPSPPLDPVSPIEWRQLANWLRRNFSDRLNERERDFIETMSAWQGRPTAKQAKWLQDIAARFAEVAA
jgi:hypothetical protein